MTRPPDGVVAVGSLLLAEAWLFGAALWALRDAGDPTGLPLAAWLMPIAAAVAPWVLPSRTERSRGTQAALGQLACIAGAGVMVLSAVAGAVIALGGIVAAAVLRR